MKAALKKGLSFGITAAVITTLGIMVGVHAGTDLRHAVIAAILIIAFADSMADALGVYFSEQTRGDVATGECLTCALTAFAGKVLFALSFIIPILLFTLHTAIIVAIAYGILVLVFYSAYVAKSRQDSVVKMISIHVLLAVTVIGLSHLIGNWVNAALG